MSATPDDATWTAMREAQGTRRTVDVTLLERIDGAEQRYPLGACVVHTIFTQGQREVAHVTPAGEDGMRVLTRPLTPRRA